MHKWEDEFHILILVFILQGSNGFGILVSLKAKPAITLYVIVNVLTESREFMLHIKTKPHFIIYVGLYFL